MYYNARWYDPTIARFVQADSVVPEGVQGYDRYAYVNNNPVRYNDPSGHYVCEGADACEHSTTVESQELAAKHKNDKHSTKPVQSTPRSGVEEGAGGYYYAPSVPIEPTDDSEPDFGMWFAGGLEMLAGVLIMDLGIITVAAVLLGEHGAGVGATPETFGLSEVLAVLHTPAVVGLGGGIAIVGGSIAWDGAKHMWNSGVLQWSFGKILEPFK